MTKPQKGPKLYVASEQLSRAQEFASVNDVTLENLVWLGPRHALRGRNDISEIWVLGEIGCETAEEVNLAIVYTGAKVRYADPNEKVELNRGR